MATPMQITYQSLVPVSAYMGVLRNIAPLAPLDDPMEIVADGLAGEASMIEQWLAYGGAVSLVALLSAGILWFT